MNNKELVWDRLKHGVKPIDLDEMLSRDLEELRKGYLEMQKEMEKTLNEERKQVHQGIINSRQKDVIAKGVKGSRGSGRACKSGAAVRQRERDYTQIYRQKAYSRRGS